MQSSKKLLVHVLKMILKKNQAEIYQKFSINSKVIGIARTDLLYCSDLING